MGREFELKFAATAQIHRAVEEKYGPFETITMETTYFDTRDRALSRRNITLRSRQENGCCVCTVKTPGVGHGRGEWDAKAPWCAETVAKLWNSAGEKGVAFEELSPVCGAKFTRLAAVMELSGCTVEVALDRGVLLGGGREMPLCEVEVEVKSGSEDLATQWAKALAAEFGLSPEPRSKFRRASALAKGE
jgi:inorganic triphosphatase YgiF